MASSYLQCLLCGCLQSSRRRPEEEEEESVHVTTSEDIVHATAPTLHVDTSASRLDLFVDRDAEALGLNAFQDSPTLEEVRMEISSQFSSRNLPDILMTISRFPKLKRLWVAGRVGFGYLPTTKVSLAALTRFLQQAPQLQELSLHQVHLFAASREEWMQLDEAVAQQSHLEDFVLQRCRLFVHGIRAERQEGVDGMDNSFALSRLVGSFLAHLPQIKRVTIGQQLEASAVELSLPTPQSLESLCHSPLLAKLTLDCPELREDHIVAMARALETSSSLKQFQISCALLGQMGCIALAQMLSVNTSLTSLSLIIDQLANDYPLPDDFVEDGKDSMYFVAQALKQNQTLRCLELLGHADYTTATQEAFATLLRTNTTLCEFNTRHSFLLPDDLQWEADLMLALNKLGRKRMIQGQASHYEWVHALWKLRRNLDGLFYLLSMNPMLCDVNGNTNTGRNP